MRPLLSDLFADPRPDLRAALRRLARQPGLTAVVVGFLAVGIGATVAASSVVDTLLLRPLPWEHEERLARIWSSHPENGWDRFGVSAEDFLDWREAAGSFDALEAYHYTEATVGSAGAPAERVQALLVTPGIFDAVGASAALGRTLGPADTRSGDDRVVVLSDTWWRRALGADPTVVGRRLQVDGEELEVVGVMPPGFVLPVPGLAYWRPLALDRHAGGRGARFLQVVGRRAPGVEPRAARGELEAIAGALEETYPDSNRGWTVTVAPAREWIVGDARRVVLLLWGAVAAVLLVVCANVATLLLARGEGRRTEMATRAALGARRARLARQMLVESLLLAGLGGGLGIGLAALALRALPSLPGIDLPRLSELSLGARPVVFAGGLVVLVAVLFGMLPALRLSGARFVALRGRALGGRGALASGMVVAQVALAVVLLVSSGLLIASLRAVLAVDPGIDADSLLTARVPLVEPDPEIGEAAAAGDLERAVALLFAARERAAVRVEEAIDRLEAIPGVLGAAAVNRPPLGGGWWITGYGVEGAAESPDEVERSAYYRAVTAGYFETAGIALLAGRSFGAADHAGGAPVVVIDQELARAAFGDADPIGARLEISELGAPPAEVIGVVASVRQRSLEEPAEPALYVPFRHAEQGFDGDFAVSLLVRTAVEPSALADPVRAELQAWRPEAPVVGLAPMSATLRAGTASRRLAGWVLGAFAAAALGVAALGVFALTLERVQRAAPALGLRLALGARPLDVALLTVRRGLALAATGLVLGSIAARLAAPALGAWLFGVERDAPVVYLTVAAALLLAAALACASPALRAARIDPARSLRAD